MKIAFLHQTMGLIHRGSEISTDLIASYLAKSHDVLVIQSGPKSNSIYKTKRVNPLITAPQAAPTGVYQKILFRLHLDPRSRSAHEFTKAALPVLNKFKPDIIVATNGAGQVQLLQKNLPDSKIVVFGRAGIGHDDLSNLRAHPDLFVALSGSAKDWAEANKSDHTQVVYIPNPIADSKAKKMDLSLPTPVVLTVGALSAYKNQSSVIRAVSHVQASLIIIGDGEESTAVAKLLSSYPGDFRWLKSVDPADMPSYYHSCDIFCFVPDQQEAFGRVYLEAMVAGLPIVASDDPIRRSIIGPHGIYVDPHNLDSIVAGLSDAHKLGKGRDYSEQLKPYLIKNVVKQIEGAFHDLIK